MLDKIYYIDLADKEIIRKEDDRVIRWITLALFYSKRRIDPSKISKHNNKSCKNILLVF
jgi:hypothetical protein